MLRPIVIVTSIILAALSCKRTGFGDDGGTRSEGPGIFTPFQTPEEAYAAAFYLLGAGARAGTALGGVGTPIVLSFVAPSGPRVCGAQKVQPNAPILALSYKCPFDDKVTNASIQFLIEEKNGQPPRAVRINIASPQGEPVCDVPNTFRAVEPAKLANFIAGAKELAATAGGQSFVNPATGAALIVGKDARNQEVKYLAPGLEVCSDRKSGLDGGAMPNPIPKDQAFIAGWRSIADFEAVSPRFLTDIRNAFFNELFLPSVGSKNKTVEDPLVRSAEEGDDNARRAVEEILAREMRSTVVARANLFPVVYPVRGTDQNCFGYGLEVKRISETESVSFAILDAPPVAKPGGKKAYEIRDWRITAAVTPTQFQKQYTHMPFVVGFFADQLASDAVVGLSPAARSTTEPVSGALECSGDPEQSCEIMRRDEVAGPMACPKLTML